MKKIYIDNEFRCYTANPDGMLREVETDFFDGKCDIFIEGYRLIPAGESWTRPDGIVLHGEMITAWKDYNELDAAQREYEREQYQALISQNAEYEAALSEIEEALGV